MTAVIDWPEIERLESYQLLTSKEKAALKVFFENGRDWTQAVYAVYAVKSLEVATQIARRMRRRQEVCAVLAQIEDSPVPTANSIAGELYRIGSDPKVRAAVRVDALDTAAVLLGYKAAPQAGRPSNEDERIRRTIEKLS